MLINILLFLFACLLVFTLMYDHCVNGKEWLCSLKERSLQFFLSPFTYFLFKVIVIGGILYLVYALMHNSSLF